MEKIFGFIYTVLGLKWAFSIESSFGNDTASSVYSYKKVSFGDLTNNSDNFVLLVLRPIYQSFLGT